MRNALIAFSMAFIALFSLVHDANAQVSPSAIFSSLSGTTTIDKGGAIHSQTRSIYSLGGGMTSFKGKSITLIAADPPSFNAGCAGISWHFGGFSFISVDEIRQMVEAVAQASLGVAVDLAMQTLCPQCYAIMSKLREMANLMRNAAFDACQIAQRLKSSLAKSDMVSGMRSKADCAKQSSETDKSPGFLGAMFDTWCNGSTAVASFLGESNKKITDFMSGKAVGDGDTTPSAEDVAVYGNWTYDALTALGYPDGVIKDVMLSTFGMTISPPEPKATCVDTLTNMFGPLPDETSPTPIDAVKSKILDAARSADDATAKAIVKNATDSTKTPTAADAVVNAPKTLPGSTNKGPQLCFAPPLISTLTEFAYHLICGFKPASDLATFSTAFGLSPTAIAQSSFGSMCVKTTEAGVSVKADSEDNPYVYHCTVGDSAKCMKPKLIKLKDISPDPASVTSKYTGVSWMIMDALYNGVLAIQQNKKRENATDKSSIPAGTIAILNHSSYPLYRLLNIAAVYPQLADDLLQAYGALIATHYVMDTMDKLMTPGGQPQVRLDSSTGNLPNMNLLDLRRDIMTQLVNEGGQLRSTVQKRMAEKKALVDVIVQINRTIQAEVVSQGLGNNANLAVSLKKQMSKVASSTTTPTTPATPATP